MDVTGKSGAHSHNMENGNEIIHAAVSSTFIFLHPYASENPIKKLTFFSCRSIWAGKWSGEPMPQCIVFTFVHYSCSDDTKVLQHWFDSFLSTDLIPLFPTEWIILLCIFMWRKYSNIRHRINSHFPACHDVRCKSNNSLLKWKCTTSQ